MTKIEAVIQNSRLEAVKTALQEIGAEGMTVTEVRGHGRQKGHTEVYRGREYSVDLIPKTKIEMVLAEAMVEKAVQAILGAARSGKIGDGKIFLSRIDEAIRIRNDDIAPHRVGGDRFLHNNMVRGRRGMLAYAFRNLTGVQASVVRLSENAFETGCSRPRRNPRSFDTRQCEEATRRTWNFEENVRLPLAFNLLEIRCEKFLLALECT